MDGAWRGEAKRGGAGAAGCEDGEEGGEAARSGTITEQAASVVALHCVAAGYVGDGRGFRAFRNLWSRYAPELLRRRHPTKPTRAVEYILVGTLLRPNEYFPQDQLI